MGIRTAKPKHWTRPDPGRLTPSGNLADCRRWHKLSASWDRLDKGRKAAGPEIAAKRRQNCVISAGLAVAHGHSQVGKETMGRKGFQPSSSLSATRLEGFGDPVHHAVVVPLPAVLEGRDDRAGAVRGAVCALADRHRRRRHGRPSAQGAKAVRRLLWLAPIGKERSGSTHRSSPEPVGGHRELLGFNRTIWATRRVVESRQLGDLVP
jgi:hypothetical protein